jgi:hypothetical protein
VGDFVELHYVYAYDEGLGNPVTSDECAEIRARAVTSSLADCAQPLVVMAVWARVQPGTATPRPQDASPFTGPDGIEYSGSTTGDSRPTKKAYWRVSKTPGSVGIEDLDITGSDPGRVQGQPSRVLQASQ